MTEDQTFYWDAAETAHRLVVEEALDQGWMWLSMTKEEWLELVTEEEYEALEQFGFDRGTKKTPDEQRTAETVTGGDLDGTGTTQMHMEQMELDPCELQKEVDEMRAEEETLEALKQCQYHYAEDDGTLEVLKEGAGGHELQKRVDEMRQLQTLIDDLRASEKPLNALTPGLSQYELQKIVDEMRAGDGTLEALKQGILNGRKITSEGTMVIQEYEVCARGDIIKVHKAELEKDPNEVKGDILNSEKITAEQKPVNSFSVPYPYGGVCA
jgi:hypothetical protein